MHPYNLLYLTKKGIYYKTNSLGNSVLPTVGPTYALNLKVLASLKILEKFEHQEM